MTRKDITKLFVRFFVVFAFCCPIFVLIGSVLDGKINGVIEVVIFVTIGGGILFLEEFLHVKALKKREEQKQITDVDKFFEQERQKKFDRQKQKLSKKAKNPNQNCQNSNQNDKKDIQVQNNQNDINKINIKAKENDNGK